MLSSQSISDKSTELSSSLTSIQVTLPSDTKFVRLRKSAVKKPRPLKIICKTKDDAVQLVIKFDRTLRIGCSIRDGLRIVRDKDLNKDFFRTRAISYFSCEARA